MTRVGLRLSAAAVVHEACVVRRVRRVVEGPARVIRRRRRDFSGLVERGQGLYGSRIRLRASRALLPVSIARLGDVFTSVRDDARAWGVSVELVGC